MILIGSSAIKYWFPDFPRNPKDKDFLIDEYQQFEWSGTRETEYLKNKVLTDLYHGTNKNVLEPNHLATLKASHLCWNVNWEKHMWDLQWLLNKGCKIDYELFGKLYNYWNSYHEPNKRSDLKMSKEDFFDNSVNYNESEHDFTHTILNPVPTYTLVLKDGAEVEVDEQKFHALSFNQKADFVMEEVMVMAYERYKHLQYKVAYSKMLKKFIISHAPIFSLPFIFENFIELHKPKFNYIKQIQNGNNQHQCA